MSSIVRTNVNEEYAYSEIVEAGDFVFAVNTQKGPKTLRTSWRVGERNS